MGLAELGDFLQRRTQWNVQKPILQQQAADAHALVQSQIGLADVQTKAAQREWAKQNLTLDPDSIVSAVSPGTNTDPGKTDNDATATAPTQPAAESQALPDAELMPPIVAPTPPKSTAPSDVQAAGNDFLKKTGFDFTAANMTPPAVSRPVGDSETPGSTDSAPVVTPKNSPNLGSTAGSPATLPPVGVSEPDVAPPKFGAQDLLVTPFQHLPAAAQTEILRQGRTQMKNAGFKITDAELIQHYNENQQRAMPLITPWNVPPGLKLKGIGEHGAEFINTHLMDDAGSGTSPQPFLMAPDGSVRDNPAYLKPADLIQRRSELATTQQAQNLLGDARSVIQKNPGAYGQDITKGAPGTLAGQLLNKGKAMLGNNKDYDAQRVLEMQNLKGMLDTLGQIHIGRVTEMEWSALSGSMPKLTDDQATWNKWLDRFDGLLGEAQSSLQDTLKPYSAGFSSPTLPPVDVSQPSVTPPSGAASPNTISTKAEYDALKKGDSFVWAPTGTAGTK